MVAYHYRYIMKAIIVEVNGTKITGKVADKSAVELVSNETIDNTIAKGVTELIAMLEGDMIDPTKKRCSRCVKMGRMPYHDMNDFSLLKNGKRHSQCKVCRVEQSKEWCTKRANHRKIYHKNYHKTYLRRTVVSKGVKFIMDSYIQSYVQKAVKVNSTAEALFVGFPTIEDIKETD